MPPTSEAMGTEYKKEKTRIAFEDIRHSERCTVRGLMSGRYNLGEDERTMQCRGGDGDEKKEGKIRNRSAFGRTLDHPHPREIPVCAGILKNIPLHRIPYLTSVSPSSTSAVCTSILASSYSSPLIGSYADLSLRLLRMPLNRSRATCRKEGFGGRRVTERREPMLPTRETCSDSWFS